MVWNCYEWRVLLFVFNTCGFWYHKVNVVVFSLCFCQYGVQYGAGSSNLLSFSPLYSLSICQHGLEHGRNSCKNQGYYWNFHQQSNPGCQCRWENFCCCQPLQQAGEQKNLGQKRKTKYLQHAAGRKNVVQIRRSCIRCCVRWHTQVSWKWILQLRRRKGQSSEMILKCGYLAIFLLIGRNSQGPSKTSWERPKDRR